MHTHVYIYQPLALEGASVGVPTISQHELFERRHVYVAKVCCNVVHSV